MGAENTSSYLVFLTHEPVSRAQFPAGRLSSSSCFNSTARAAEVAASSSAATTASAAAARVAASSAHAGSWNTPSRAPPLASCTMSS